MDRIIRLNATHTLSQSDSLEMICHDLHPYQELAPEMALIKGGSITATTNTGMSTSLQKLLHQQLRTLLYLVILGSVVKLIRQLRKGKSY